MSIGFLTPVRNSVELLGTDTSLLRTVSNVPTKFSCIFLKKKKKKNLYNTNPHQMNLHGVNPVQSGWGVMQGDIKPSRCIPNKDFRKVYAEDFFKASVTTDSIKIFSVTFCTLVTVYCTCKIAKDAFRIVLYVTTFYMQHCPVAGFV